MKLARPWVFICLAGVLCACGQKGPLVLPDAQKHKRTIPAPPTAAPEPAVPGASAPTDSPAHP